MLSVGSLFAGIGGFDLGFTACGYNIAWQVERDPWCRRVLAKHWPNVPRFSEIEEVGRHNLSRVDVICGGFPCQDISLARPVKGKGLDGERSSLWWEMYRVVSELRPLYVVVENVPNLLNEGIDRVCGALAEIGYDAEWHVISAEDVGAPHTRKRIWIISYPHRKHGTQCNIDPQGHLDHRIGAHTIRHGALGGWEAEPPALRISDGVPNRVDRLRGLGNSLSPHIALTLAKLIEEDYNRHMKIIIEVEINTRVVTSEEEQGATTGATAGATGSQEIVLVPVVEQEDEVPSTKTSTENLDTTKNSDSEHNEQEIVTSNGHTPRPTCTEEGCDAPVTRKGLCNAHYMQQRRKQYEPSIQAQSIFERWRKHPEIDYKSRYKDHWCKVFDDLHRIDRVPWDEIRAISEFASKNWVPRFMQSPTKLRQPSKAYPEKKCWEIIQSQMKGELTNDPSDAGAFVDDIDFS
jgi:DNA (cytosine-5)-methyltransferase 1